MPNSDTIGKENASNGLEQKKKGLKPQVAFAAIAGAMLLSAISPFAAIAMGSLSLSVAGGIAGERLVTKLSGKIRNTVASLKANRSSGKSTVFLPDNELTQDQHLLENQPVAQKQPSNNLPEPTMVKAKQEFSGLIVDGSGNLVFIEDGLNMAAGNSHPGVQNDFGELSAANPLGTKKVAISGSQVADDSYESFKSPQNNLIRPKSAVHVKNVADKDKENIQRNYWKRRSN